MRTIPTLAVLALLTGLTPAEAVQPAELLGTDLKRQSIRFVGFSDGTLRFFDADRRLRKAQAAGFVSLRLKRQGPDGAAESARDATDETEQPGRMIELADGQRIRGRFAGTKDGELTWKTDRFGELAFPLDRIHQAVLATGEDAPDLTALSSEAETTSDDLILLANGDTLTGFIEAAGPDGLAVEIEGQRLTLGWDRVAAIRLPNPMQQAPGVWLRLRDGSRLRVEDAALDSETFTGKAFGGRPIELPTGAIAAVDFAERHRLVPLGDLSPTTVSGGHVFGVPMPPEFEGPRARLHAPLTLRFELPAGATRFAADAVLDPADLNWADLALSVRDGQGERFSEPLNAEQPEARVNADLRDRTLILHLDEAANGPIRDRLTLRNAVILVKNAE